MRVHFGRVYIWIRFKQNDEKGLPVWEETLIKVFPEIGKLTMCTWLENMDVCVFYGCVGKKKITTQLASENNDHLSSHSFHGSEVWAQPRWLSTQHLPGWNQGVPLGSSSSMLMRLLAELSSLLLCEWVSVFFFFLTGEGPLLASRDHPQILSSWPPP